MSNGAKTDAKVIQIFGRSKENADGQQKFEAGICEKNADLSGEEPSFEDVMRRNEENNQRIAKERANANKSVLRTYRIKH